MLKNLFVSLQSRNFKLYYTGQSISLIGSWMQQVAMSWLVYRITGSVLLLGVVGFTNQIPTFIFSPFAGVITDRFNRKRIMLFTQIAFALQAVAMAVFTLSGTITVTHIIALSLVFGLISVFDTPARQALVIDLIDNRDKIGNAVALNSAMFNAARIVGPGIAGWAIAQVGEGICFLANAFTYVAVIAALAAIPLTHTPKPSGKIADELREGFNYIRSHKRIRNVILLLSIISLIGLPVLVLLPAYAKDVLHGDSKTFGLLMSASGVGALAGALYLAQRNGAYGLIKLTPLTTAIFGASIALLCINPPMWLTLCILPVLGFSMICSIASVNTIIQSTVADQMRGRVMSFYAVALMGMNPIGSFFAGFTALYAGLNITLLVCGLTTMLGAVWFVVVTRQK